MLFFEGLVLRGKLMDKTTPLFGISMLPSANDLKRTIALAKLADQLGLDIIAMQDHPYNPAFVDTWTLMTTLGAETQQIRLLTDVANLPLRPPAMLAKAAATLDLLTGGRFELGLGAGWNWDGVASYGGPRRSPGEATQALEESMQVIRSAWQPLENNETRNFNGKFYALEAIQPGPAPVHPIGIWLGAYKPRMLELTGRLADGWIPSAGILPPGEVLASQKRVDRAAEKAGRSPDAVRRAYNLGGVIVTGEGPLIKPTRPGVIIGSPEYWVNEINRFIQDLRLDTFIFYPISPELETQIRAFAKEVVPAVRAAVGSAKNK
jgi:alkanesulfonate monooxygenase SsuD/methylene tetrahydromethanopterin reductase-like flavin-dependent oxidoreductase (luciferase family)